MNKSQEDATGAVRLVVQVPSYVHHHEKEEITVLAVDSNGQVDRTRNDEIELTLTPMYKLDDSQVKLESNFIRLVNGEAKVAITSHESEFVKITASCKDKSSELQPYTVLLATGGFPFHQ